MNSNFQIKLRSDLKDFISFFRAHCHPLLYQKILAQGSAEFAIALFNFFEEQHFDFTLSDCTLGTLERKTVDIHTGETQIHPFSHCILCVFNTSFDVLGVEAAENWAQNWVVDTQKSSSFTLTEHQSVKEFSAIVQSIDDELVQQIYKLLVMIYPLWINTRC